ncbi:hypothetical protein DYB32_001225 [Aphanomyces invadans]|uniref:EF-hand domain-containing protein n=1 Tax=Aphanomyces invadans TaxID=157072 RepID=A0A418B7D6_9STRA|nr:hypothetical protein DYB32_001225 [Aphanomyces invadans]
MKPVIKTKPKLPTKLKGKRGSELWPEREKVFERFRKENLVMPVPEGPLAPARVNKVSGYSVDLHLVKNWPLTEQLEGAMLTYGLQMTFFHSLTKRFFGNTWLSPELLDNGKADVVVQISVGFISDVVDPNCVAVVELVAFEKDPASSLTTASHGCGWCLLPMFGQKLLGLAHETLTVNVFAGSPRHLYVVNQADWQNQTKVAGCKLLYHVHLHDGLTKLHALVRKNEIVSSLDKIPGLKGDNLVGSTQANVAVFQIPREIAMAEDFSIVVTPVQAFVHLREELEQDLIERLAKTRKLIHKDVESVHGEVATRVLKVALHNGRCFRTRQHTVPLKCEHGSNTLTAVTESVKLKGYTLSPLVAVVVLLQCTVHFRLVWPKGAKPKNDKEPLPTEDVVVVTIGARALVPSDGKKFYYHDRSLLRDQRGANKSICLNWKNHSTRPYSDNVIYTSPVWKNALKAGKLEESFASCDMELLVEGAAMSSESEGDDEETKNDTKPETDRDAWLRDLYQKAQLDAALARTLQAPLQKSAATSPTKRATNQPPHHPQHTLEFNDVPTTVITDDPTPSYELSRASKSLLTRHGFYDTVTSVPVDNNKQHIPPSVMRPLPPVKTVEDELKDGLNLLEIQFQFAAFRALAVAPSGGPPTPPLPASLFFSFQFYTFEPTKSERLVVTSTPAAGTYLLCRDHAKKPSLAIQFELHTTKQCPLEAAAFATYLLTKSLHVDVWDGDSLLPLGSMIVPLRELMRQGQRVKKYHAEFEVRRSADAMAPAALSVNSSIGAVQLLMSNFASSSTTCPPAIVKPVGDADATGNWRFATPPSSDPMLLQKGPRHRVRAKPLADSNEELKQLLVREHLYDPNPCSRSAKNSHGNNHTRGHSDATSITKDEIERLCRRFQTQTTRNNRLDAVALLALFSVSPVKNEAAAATFSLAEDVRQAFLNAFARGVDFRMMFDALDASGDGTLTTAEFIQGVYTLGPEFQACSPHSLREVVDSFDANHDGTINYVEFVAFLNKHLHLSIRQELQAVFVRAAQRGVNVAALFRQLDTSGDGQLTAREFEMALKHVGYVVASDKRQDFDKFCRSLDDDGNGSISYLEFIQHMGLQTLATDSVLATLLAILKRTIAKGVDIGELFLHIDTDGSGAVSYPEFMKVLTDLDLDGQLNAAMLQEIVLRVDKDKSGSIDIAEFLAFVQIPFDAAKMIQSRLHRILTRAADQGVSVQDAFSQFDHDGSGEVSAMEFQAALKALKCPLGPAELNVVLDKCDANRDGSVSYKEFLTFVFGQDASHVLAKPIQVQLAALFQEASARNVDLAQCFAHFDKDGSREISTAEFMTALKEFGMQVDDNGDTMRAIVDLLDKNKDGKINYDEFVALATPRTRAREDPPPIKLFKMLEKALADGVDVESAFAHFDKHSTGAVSYADFHSALNELGTTQWTSAEMESIFKHLDKDGGGTVSLREFRTFLDVTPAKRLKALLVKAQAQGVAMAQSFGHFTATDRIDLAAFEVGLAKLQFTDFTKNDIQGLFATINTSKSGQISIEELGAFVGTTPPTTTTAEPTMVVSPIDKLKELLVRARSQGVDIHASFSHFDKDKDGSITYDELDVALKELNFDFTQADIDNIRQALDKDESGCISLDEFQKLFSPAAAPGKTNYMRKTRSGRQQRPPLSKQGSASSKVAPSLKKLQDLLLQAKDQGIDVADAFSQFDTNGNGVISFEEFDRTIAKLRLDGLTAADLADIRNALDRDKSGSISMEDFKVLYEPLPFAKPQAPSTAGANGGAKPWLAKNGSKKGSASAALTQDAPKPAATPISGVAKLGNFLRLAKEKGVDVDQAFSHFDADGNGSISYVEFSAALTALHLEAITETDVDEIRCALDKGQNGMISLDEFKKLYALPDTALQESNQPNASADASMTPLSTLCTLLRKAQAAGIDIDQAFKHFDADGNGTITRIEFATAIKDLRLDGLSDDDVATIQTTLDKDESGTISLDEFQKLYSMNEPPVEGTDVTGVPITGAPTVQKGSNEEHDAVKPPSSKDLRATHETAGNEAVESGDCDKPVKKEPSTETVAAATAVEKLREFLLRAQATGVDIDLAFQHFDGDGNGSISITEFDAAMLELHMDSLSEADVAVIREALDTDKSGVISMASFKRLYADSPWPDSTSPGGTNQPVHAPIAAESASIQKLSRLLREAIENGADVAKAFGMSDGQDSAMSYVELDAALMELGLDDLTEEDMVVIRNDLDGQHAGAIARSKIAVLWMQEHTMPANAERKHPPVSREGSANSIKAASSDSDVEAKATQPPLTKQASSNLDEPSSVPAEDKDPSKGDKQLASAAVDASTRQNENPGSATSPLERLRALLLRAKDSGVNIDQAFQHFDKDGNGAISYAEFKAGLNELHLDGFSDTHVESVIHALDKDNSGSISLQEFKKLYKPPPKCGRDSSKGASKPWLAKEASKAQPDNEVKAKAKKEACVALSVANPATASNADVTTAGVDKLKVLLLRAKEKGVDIAAAFSHFDADGDGAITATEFETGLTSLQFDLCPDDVAAIQAHLDRDKSGVVSLKEFQALYDTSGAGVSPESSTTAKSTRTESDSTVTKPPLGPGKRPSIATSSRQQTAKRTTPSSPLLDQLQKILLLAKDKGVDVDQAFAHFDTDSDGHVTYAEFDKALAELGVVNGERDADEVHRLLDKDQSGTIAMTEFKQLYSSKTLTVPEETHPPPRSSSRKVVSAKQGVCREEPLETLRALLVRAQSKGVDVSQSFAHFDRDGNGSISYDEFASALKQLQVDFTPEDIATLCKTLDKDTNSSISLNEFKKLYQVVPPLSKMPSNGASIETKGASSDKPSSRASKSATSDVSSSESSKSSQTQPPVQTNFRRPQDDKKKETTARQRDGIAMDTTVMSEYRFSAEPETRMLEMKLRKAAVAALARGVPATALLGKYTQKPTGEVLRVDFVQFLMELGLSVIDDLGTAGYICDVPPATMYDKVYARQLERLRQFRHHHRDSSMAKSQRELVRAASMSNHLVPTHGQAQVDAFLAQKNKMLQVVQYYRDGHKKALIHALLRDHVTTTIHVFPRFGTMLFFEFPVRNPYGHAERFRIEWHDPELVLVLDAVEWRYYRDRVPVCVDMGGAGNVEVDMIDDLHEILLEGSDAVVLPFRLMTLQMHKQSRVVPVYVKSVAHGHVVSVLQIHIQPLAFVCHRTHRLFHAAGGILRRCLKLLPPGLDHDDCTSNQAPSHGRRCNREKFVACADAGVVVETKPIEKISYRNPWDDDRMFVLRSSDTTIMKPREPTLRLPGNADGFLRLAFAPYSISCTKKVYLFINDGTDQNEECLLLHVTWTDHQRN